MAEEQKVEALGGNFKVKDIKIFGSKENLYRNEKKYRRVFDVRESKFIYCEFSFYNKLFDEYDWSTSITFVCIDTKLNKQICELKKEVDVSKEKNVIYVREGWGTNDPGWWRKSNYKWEVRIDNRIVGSLEFYIVNGGLVTEIANPYFDIKMIRLYESPRNSMPFEQRKYLSVFSSIDTRYLNLELHLEKKYEDQLFPLELRFNVYNDAGQYKASMYYFKVFGAEDDTILLDAGYGSDKTGFWYNDNYTIEILFMDQMIGVVPVLVGTEELELEGEQMFSTSSELEQLIAKQEELPAFEDAKSELEALIGLDSVKKQINELADYLKFLKLREEKGIKEDQELNLHTLFTGNPGTGKTTVAKMLGLIYASLGLLSSPKVMEVGRAELVGEYIGQTAPKVKKVIEEARGGILFIDEAYALTNRGDDGKDFGREVVEILLKEMSDGKGDLAIVFAGYPKEMKQFMESNPGLNSRIRNIISFPDYNPDELLEIASFTADQKGVVLDDEAKALIHKKLIETYRNRDEKFGNARYVIGIIEEAKQNLGLRIMKNAALESLDPSVLSTINVEDIEKIFKKTAGTSADLPIDEALLKDALDQLNNMVGLDNVKKEIEDMTKLVRYYKEIGKDIKKSFSIHSVFIGNPGTGKTTVARLLVQIYKALGILERGHLVEVDRKSLVAGFVGQTAIKTGEVIAKAMGGGLFIDEAYALTQGGQSDFGREAIEILLKEMEDKRGEFMIIVAGYPKEMNDFIQANPGLMSRFDKRYNFPDYSAEQLKRIAMNLFDAEELKLEPKAEEHLASYIVKLVDKKHKYFGNARTVRKIVIETSRKQNLRMSDLPKDQRTPLLMQTILQEDLQGFTLLEEESGNEGRIGFNRET